MKRIGNLWHLVIDENNLYLAAKQAMKGKRYQENVLQYNSNLAENISMLRHELIAGIYQPGGYRTFEIHKPKHRIISAAPFRDRVVHHALCNVIQPIFEKSFISDTYANRVGYGTHKALKRFTEFARSSKYVLQCDIERYFPSIDHEILKDLIRRKIKCPQTLWLIDKIIDNSNPQEERNIYFDGDDLFTPFERRRGLPIGNLTSQFFANVYLDGLDHFVREKLRIGKYVRYVDDFSLFSDNKETLEDCRFAIENYLVKLRLRIHKIKSQIFQTKIGANFVGFRVLPDRVRVKTNNLNFARYRLRKMTFEYAHCRLEFSKIMECLNSWSAHLKHADSFQLRSDIFQNLVFTRRLKYG